MNYPSPLSIPLFFLSVRTGFQLCRILIQLIWASCCKASLFLSIMDNLQAVQYACFLHSFHQGQNGNLWVTWSGKLPTEPSHGTQPYCLTPASFPDFLSSCCFLFPYHTFALPHLTFCLTPTGKFSAPQLLCLSHGGVLRKAIKAKVNLKGKASKMIISAVERCFLSMKEMKQLI